MSAEMMLMEALATFHKKISSETTLEEDLGLNWWGKIRLGMYVEYQLQLAGFRALTDEEIKSWRTIGDVIATIKEAKRTSVKARRGPPRKT